MKKIVYICALLISAMSLQNCEDTYLPPDLEYITFAKTNYSTGVDIGGSATVDVTVYTGSNANTDMTYNLIVDASGAADGSYDVPTTVTIPQGTNEGVITVGLSDTDLGIGINTIDISLEEDGSITVGNSTSVSYSQNCIEVDANVDIVLDAYGSETSWSIIDALGGTVASGGPYTDGQASASESFTLCSGREYTFTFLDSYGDGIDGTYLLTVGGESKASGGGNFGTTESTSFDTN